LDVIQRASLTLVYLAPLVALGGAYRWFTLPLLAIASLALLANSRAAITSGRHQRLLDHALLVGCGAIALQVVPLPAAVADWLSPESARVRNALRLGAPAPDVWRPLSIHPEATLHAFAAALSATFAFFAARGLFSSGGLRRWCRVLAWIGLLVALVALAQRATTPMLIYGFWPPREVNGQPFGPFVNRNHFAAWLLMAMFVTGGYAVAHARIHIGAGPRHVRRLLRVLTTAGTQAYVTAAVVMAVTIVITLSRSAMAGLVAGTLSAAVLLRPRIEATAVTRASWAAAAIVVGLIVATGFVDSTRVAARVDETLRSGADSRLVIWRESLPLVRDFWVAGVGAGAYGDAMLMYEGANAPVHFNQAHSHYLQVAAEGGLLLLIPWLVAAMLFARYARDALADERGEIAFVRLGAACGMAAIAVQSVWETPLRMGANAVLFALLAGLVVHRRRHE
jgi:O-antigen ligase